MTAKKKARGQAGQQHRTPRVYVNRSRRSRAKLRTRLGAMLIWVQQPLPAAEQQAGWGRFAAVLMRYYVGTVV